MISYYCPKDKKFVSTMRGEFNHPHLGLKSCFLCRKCGTMVYLKEQVSPDGGETSPAV